MKALLTASVLLSCTIAAAGVKDTIRAVAVKNKVSPDHLQAMAWVESRYNPKAVGDNGRSRGCFQIQTKLHKITVKQAEDVRFASQWTVNYLIKNGYRKDPRKAIRKHNGSGKMAERYADKVLRKAKEIRREGK